MLSLLDATVPYIKDFLGIRISTRPDYINIEILEILKKYNVTTIELGAQSMDDYVLLCNNRGHNSKSVIDASKLIKEFGFNLGLQMMTGLYKATFETDVHTANEFIKIRPDCVRIYNTIVVADTQLEKLYLSGDFNTYSLNESVDICSKLLLMFYNENIDVIRLGLHYSDSLSKGSVSDNYHPAFKELCESKIFLDKILCDLKGIKEQNITLTVNKKSVSKLVGQNKSNLTKLKELGYKVEILTDDKLNKYDVIVREQGVMKCY